MVCTGAEQQGWASRRSRVLPEEAAGVLGAVRHAKRLREPGWEGDKGQGRWLGGKPF